MLDAIEETYGDRLNLVTLDVREHGLLAMRYGVESIPTFVFCDGAGKEVSRHVGPAITVARARALIAKLGVKAP